MRIVGSNVLWDRILMSHVWLTNGWCHLEVPPNCDWFCRWCKYHFFQSDSNSDARTAAGQEQLPVYHFPSMSSPQQHPNADVMKIIIIHVTFVDIIGRWSRDRHASSQQLVDLAQYKTTYMEILCSVYTSPRMGPRGIQTRRRDQGIAKLQNKPHPLGLFTWTNILIWDQVTSLVSFFIDMGPTREVCIYRTAVRTGT